MLNPRISKYFNIRISVLVVLISAFGVLGISHFTSAASISFTASPSTILSGGASTLNWSVSGFPASTTVSISPGVPSGLSLTGSAQVRPTATTTYTITVQPPGTPTLPPPITSTTIVTVTSIAITPGGAKLTSADLTTARSDQNFCLGKFKDNVFNVTKGKFKTIWRVIVGGNCFIAPYDYPDNGNPNYVGFASNNLQSQIKLSPNGVTQQQVEEAIGGQETDAQKGAVWSQFLGYILTALATVINGVLTLFAGTLWGVLMETMKATIGFGDNQPAIVVLGWTIVRDIMNMVFVLAMIAMSLATILQIEAYNWKKILPKLIIMALLINFSLVISTSIISVFDLLIKVFTPDSWKDIFKTLYGMVGSGWSAAQAGVADAAVSAIGSIIFFVILIIVSLALTALFVVRMIGLYVLVIFSPIAYALYVLPVTEQYAKKWWDTFFKYLIWGPVAVFFMWLTLQLAKDGALAEIGIKSSAFSFVILSGFLAAAVMVAKQAGMVGSEAIVSMADKGIKGTTAAPFMGAWHGSRAALGLAQEKLLEGTGVETRVGKWIEGWKKSRDLSREAREAKGAAKALDRKSALASPATAFQRYWHPEGLKRVLQGGEKKGRDLLKQAEEMKKKAVLPDNQQMRHAKNLRTEAARLQKEAESATGLIAVDLKVKAQALLEKANDIEKPFQDQRTETLRQARVLESTGKKLIAPDDYLTQQKVRGAIDEEMHTIHTNNWHELVDLFESAEREGKPIRAAAIMQHLTKTFNENELVNSSKYTRDMIGADGKLHRAGEHFTFSAQGVDDFRKQILEEKLGLGEEASKMIMSDVSDMAEDTKHFEIMRMYVSENGKLRLKRPEEREPEISAELDKMGTNKVLSEGNRLVGSREVPDADYDIYQTRTTHIEPHLVAYYLKNYAAVKFLLNRGQMNPSQAKAAAEKQNREIIMKAANLLDDVEEVEPIVGVSEVLKRKGLKDTRKQQYVEIMNQLIHYGATKGDNPATGKSRIEEVQQLFRQEIDNARNARKAARAAQRGSSNP